MRMQWRVVRYPWTLFCFGGVGVGGEWQSNREHDVHRPPNNTVRSCPRSCSCMHSRPLVLAFVPSPSPFAARHHPCRLHHPADSTLRPCPRPRDQSNPEPRLGLARQKNVHSKPRRRRVCSVTACKPNADSPQASYCDCQRSTRRARRPRHELADGLRIRSTHPRVIASPPTRKASSFPPPHTHPNTLPLEPRRAAVALIIRVVPPPNFPLPPKPTAPPSLTQFFDFDWVKHPSACPEILFVRRQKPENADIN
jgi:hypothetical protein